MFAGLSSLALRDAGSEATMNSFRWLLDNRIHLSTSYSGGQVPG